MADWFAQNAPKQTNTDWFAQNAPGQAPVEPNAGLAPPAGGQPQLTKVNGKLVGAPPPVITNAPEESGLETGPLVSYNPAENDTLKHGAGSARALARMIHSAGEAMNPVTQIPAMFHAAIDKPQDSEQAAEEQGAEAGGAASGMPPALSRFLYRTAVKPTANAIEDYSAGRVTPEAAMENSPEALGGAAGTVVGGKLLDVLGGKVAGKPISPEFGLKAPALIGAGAPVDLVGQTYSPGGGPFIFRAALEYQGRCPRRGEDRGSRD